MSEPLRRVQPGRSSSTYLFGHPFWVQIEAHPCPKKHLGGEPTHTMPYPLHLLAANVGAEVGVHPGSMPSRGISPAEIEVQTADYPRWPSKHQLDPKQTNVQRMSAVAPGADPPTSETP